MSAEEGSVIQLFELMRTRSPEYVNLITARTDEEFEQAFDALLDQAVVHLETNGKNFSKLDEEGLSATLAGRMSMPGLSVSQEKNSNGHVDLTFEADHCTPMRRKLGEAKIYDGPAYHFKGLEQLLGRYTTGREGRGLLIVYFRTRDITGLVQRLRKNMDEALPSEQQGATADHVLKWSFLSVHSHSCGEHLHVGHVGCNLYTG